MFVSRYYNDNIMLFALGRRRRLPYNFSVRDWQRLGEILRPPPQPPEIRLRLFLFFFFFPTRGHERRTQSRTVPA